MAGLSALLRARFYPYRSQQWHSTVATSSHLMSGERRRSTIANKNEK